MINSNQTHARLSWQVATACLLVWLAAVKPSLAQIPAARESSDPEISVTPYLWTAGLGGEVGFRGQSGSIDASFGDIFDSEAKKYNVYPLDSSFADRANPAIRPSLTRGRTEFTYFSGMIRIPEGTAPDVKNKSFSISADVDVPANGTNGVLVTQGGRFCGWALLVLDGKPVFVHGLSNQTQHKYRIASGQRLAPGKHVVSFDFKYDGGGIGKGGTSTLTVDGKKSRRRPNRACGWHSFLG